jgi:hypothetical protein
LFVFVSGPAEVPDLLEKTAGRAADLRRRALQGRSKRLRPDAQDLLFAGGVARVDGHDDEVGDK